MTDFTLGPGPLTPEFEQIKSDIGIVENGDVATHAIPSGYYVIWKGDLYVAKTDISSGTTLSTSNLTAKTQGIGAEVSALNDKLATRDFTTVQQFKDACTSLQGAQQIAFRANTTVSTFITGASAVASGIITRASTDIYDIIWVTNSGQNIGSSRYGAANDTITINNSSLKINKLSTATNKGSIATYAALKTALNEVVANMDVWDVCPVYVSISTAFETFYATRYIGYVYVTYVTTGRKDLVAVLTSAAYADSITVTCSNNVWKYYDSKAYAPGEYVYLPLFLLGYGTSATAVRFYLYLPKMLMKPTEKTLTADFTLNALVDTSAATTVSLTGASISNLGYSGNWNLMFDVSGLTGISSNKIYRLTVSGNKRIAISEAT